MDTAQLALEFIKVLVYPAVIVFGLALFRRELRALFGGTLTAKYKDLVITLDRERRVRESLQENQAVVLRKLEGEVAKRQPDTIAPDHLADYVRALFAIRGHWQNLVIDHLRHSGGSARRQEIVASLTETSDPWRAHKDADEVEAAILDLLQRGFASSPDGRTIMLHPLFLEKPSGARA